MTTESDEADLTQLMLKNENYFNMTGPDATNLSTMAGQIGNIPPILLGIFTGFFYDLFGRRCFLVFCLILIGVLSIMRPYTSPSVSLYLASVAAFKVFVGPVM